MMDFQTPADDVRGHDAAGLTRRQLLERGGAFATTMSLAGLLGACGGGDGAPGAAGAPTTGGSPARGGSLRGAACCC